MSDPAKPPKKFRLDRKVCGFCQKPTDYQLEGAGILRIKCWHCGRLLEMQGKTYDEDVIWKSREDHQAKQEAATQSN